MPKNLPARLAVSAVLLALSACSSCADHPAEPVTFRVVNKLAWPIFVADEFEQLGLTVESEQSSGAWADLSEFASCDCQECSLACEACECPAQATFVRRIAAGGQAERTWQGEYRADEHVNCYSGEVLPCLGERLPAQPGTYRVRLCWASSVPGASSGTDRFEATLPADLTCVSRTFESPADGTVIVETDAPPGCLGPEDCPSDQMCLGGECSATCLPNTVPDVGGDWTVEIGEPDNYGFFAVTSGANGEKIYQGTGTVANARYTSGTTNLTLTRQENGLDYTAALYYTLPASRALPLVVGDAVEVTVIDYASGSRQRARAVVLRRAGELLLAADNGYGGPVLDAEQTAPFAIGVENDVFACDLASCGMRLHRRLHAALGEEALVLDAGKAGTMTSGERTFELVSVANYRDEVAGCGPRPFTPYVILVQDDE